MLVMFSLTLSEVRILKSREDLDSWQKIPYDPIYWRVFLIILLLWRWRAPNFFSKRLAFWNLKQLSAGHYVPAMLSQHVNPTFVPCTTQIYSFLFYFGNPFLEISFTKGPGPLLTLGFVPFLIVVISWMLFLQVCLYGQSYYVGQLEVLAANWNV